MDVFGRRRPLDETPSDGVQLKRSQISGFYEVVVRTWQPQSDIWALTHGGKILGVAGALSGMYGNMYFRKKMRLKNYGFFTTYLPNMTLPFLILNSFHTMVIQKDIFEDPLGCSICKGTRAALLQVGIGWLQPLVLVPLSTFMFATRHFTFRIPSPVHDRNDFWKFCKKLYAPLKIPMGINIGVQILLAFFITHMEENQFFYLQKAITKPKENVGVDET